MKPHEPNYLIFSQQDVDATTAVLPRLIREIFVKHGITNEMYLDRYRKHFFRVHPDRTQKEFTQIASSDRKFLLDPRQLWPSLFRRVVRAMGFQIVKFEYPVDVATVIVAPEEVGGAWSDVANQEVFFYSAPNPLLDAGLKMQEAIRKVLSDVSFQQQDWWDELVGAQQQLSAATSDFRHQSR